MRLRLDALLADLRDRTEAILAAIDADPLLIHRQSGDLVLANASKALYTPVEEYQLHADLRARTEAILAAIDADPLLIHRQSGDLVLANASKALYTPVEEYQLY